MYNLPWYRMLRLRAQMKSSTAACQKEKYSALDLVCWHTSLKRNKLMAYGFGSYTANKLPIEWIIFGGEYQKKILSTNHGNSTQIRELVSVLCCLFDCWHCTDAQGITQAWSKSDAGRAMSHKVAWTSVKLCVLDRCTWHCRYWVLLWPLTSIRTQAEIRGAHRYIPWTILI